MSGIQRIAAERQRQIEKEGWSAEHDMQHKLGELIRAAISYARVAKTQDKIGCYVAPDRPGDWDWPWEKHWFKPSADPIRNLEKAGALIAAEIDRLAAGQRGFKTAWRIAELAAAPTPEKERGKP